MSDEFLAKFQGFSRTFVIHSNNNPHADAAAMGWLSARWQETESYFRVSDRFIPNADILAIKENNIDSAPNQIDTDFKNDWVTYLRSTALPTCSLKYEDSLHATTKHHTLSQCTLPSYPGNQAPNHTRVSRTFNTFEIFAGLRGACHSHSSWW